eukprot:scaffold407381_cov22-Prasinocladus_malaysianus.AAC.1
MLLHSHDFISVAKSHRQMNLTVLAVGVAGAQTAGRHGALQQVNDTPALPRKFVFSFTPAIVTSTYNNARHHPISAATGNHHKCCSSRAIEHNWRPSKRASSAVPLLDAETKRQLAVTGFICWSGI